MSFVSDLRKALSLSQRELADRLEISQPSVAHLEAGRVALSVKLALRLEDQFPDQVEAAGGLSAILRSSRAAGPIG